LSSGALTVLMKRLYFDVVFHVDEDAKVEGLEEGWDVW
jgi:hypothetical protein